MNFLLVVYDGHNQRKFHLDSLGDLKFAYEVFKTRGLAMELHIPATDEFIAHLTAGAVETPAAG